MSAKSIRFHELARYKMFAGVNMLAHAVKVTTGRNLVLERPAGELMEAGDDRPTAMPWTAEAADEGLVPRRSPRPG
jgi:hypothetical protein